MSVPPSQEATAGRIAALEAAIRYWDSEAKTGPPDRADMARIQLAEMRAQLADLRSAGIENAAC